MEKENSQQHLVDHETPKKNSSLFDGETLLKKINILTTKCETTCTKVNNNFTIDCSVKLCNISRFQQLRILLSSSR